MEIDGKTYVFVESIEGTGACYQCVFLLDDQKCDVGLDECCKEGNENKCWKLKEETK